MIGEKLGKTIAEVRALPEMEFIGWTRYFAVKAQTRQLQEMQATSRFGR